jgi:hypothetical protein
MRARIIGTAGVALALGGFSAAATMASFSAETTNPTNGFASGTLVLSNKKNTATACLSTAGGTTDTNINNSCDTLFSTNLAPGGTAATANVTLKNEGTLAASALKLWSSACAAADTAAAYHGTGDPCTNLQITIQQYSDAFTTPSACVYGGGTATTCALNSSYTLSTYATAHTGSGAAQTIGSGLASGTSTYFTITVFMPSTAGNSYQGRQGTMDLTWHIDQ